MKSIHVVYGPGHCGRTLRAYRLAVEERDVFVHEIRGAQDMRQVLSSHYSRCIAILKAGDEPDARTQIGELVAAAAQASSPELTFEAAPRQCRQ